jgi:hypothetical protein
MRPNYDTKTIQARIKLLRALKLATAEAKKLNLLLDEMHEMLVANETKQAA